jgi:nitrile hydratase accessory protein
MNVDPEILGQTVAAPASLPRRNGELVFEAPWESRAFGVSIAMVDEGAYSFPQFRDFLMEEIDAWETMYGADDPEWSYYAQWLRALERVLTERNILDVSEIDARMDKLKVQRAHEHDSEPQV